MRSRGIGPISKWVDDHIFFRIKRRFLAEYNLRRKQWARDITENGGEIHDGGHLWFKGAIMPDDRPEEFDEDSSFTFRDLSQASRRLVFFSLPALLHAIPPLKFCRSHTDEQFTYCMADIDALSDNLGIPWEADKDIPLSRPFHRFRMGPHQLHGQPAGQQEGEVPSGHLGMGDEAQTHPG
jgi:hypothetical protein